MKRLITFLLVFYFILIGNTLAMEEIGLLPLSKPALRIEKGLLENLSFKLSDIFNKKVVVLKEEDIPESTYFPKRNQYHSSRIMEKIRLDFRRSFHRILAVVDVDLFVPGLNFVFGEADLAGGIAMISVTRLREEFWGKPENKRLFGERVLKEAVHELGHTYGFSHCHDVHCVMHFSNSLNDTDIKSYQFCSKCKRLLKQ